MLSDSLVSWNPISCFLESLRIRGYLIIYSDPLIPQDEEMNARETYLVKELAFFMRCTDFGFKDMLQSQPRYYVTTTRQIPRPV